MNDVAIFMLLFGICGGVALTLLFIWACNPHATIQLPPQGEQAPRHDPMKAGDWWKNGVSPEDFDLYQ
jgi:hypothetical protein